MRAMRRVVLLLLLLSSGVQAEDGLVNVRSQFSAQETMQRFATAVEEAGLSIFTRIDHAKAAAKIDKTLRPTELIIFGSPKVGTDLMSSDQRVGIDLPLKALVWQDKEGVVWLSYTRPDYLLGRFHIHDRPKIQQKITAALAKFANAATRPGMK